MEKKLEVIYKILRVLIFMIPVLAVIVGMYLILFPIETYKYYPNQPNLSKIDIERNSETNSLSFGAFPIQNHRFIDLDMNFKKTENESCLEEVPEITVQKSYRAFLFPEGDPIENVEDLRSIVFFGNTTKYPNGSLLHLKPTDEVYVITNGKKILFPGPEIFRAFGYSFDNLIDVEKSVLDQFPNADNRVFLWTHPHPDGTIFQSFPSHKTYIIADGKKRLIENENLLEEVRTDYFSIAVSDTDLQAPISCLGGTRNISNGKLECRFDSFEIAENIGRYYHFNLTFPEKCSVESIDIQNAKIAFIAEKSYATAKDSLRTIFISILNRYLYKQNI